MIGVVIPVHNEEAHLAACLAAARRAACHPLLGGEAVEIVAVLDACTDDSAAIARAAGVTTLVVQCRCVGQVRAVGAEYLLSRGARWLAFSDADSLVSAGWLASQLSLRADVVCGTVEVADWSGTPDGAREEFLRRYFDMDGHRHIHGANLGLSARSYRQAGGFPPLPAHEDVALVRMLMEIGAHICWSALPRVITSARLRSRTEGGFADYLNALQPLCRLQREDDGIATGTPATA